MRLALLWELSNVILKLGFRHIFDGKVDGDTENRMCIEFAMYLLSFFVEIKECVHQVLVAMPNSIFLASVE